MFSTSPPPDVARSQQAFRVWIRPVPLEQTTSPSASPSTTRQARAAGMTQADFEATRDFLNKSTGLLTAQQGTRLGYTLDQQFYGVKQDYTDYIRGG
jgi:zinc protease